MIPDPERASVRRGLVGDPRSPDPVREMSTSWPSETNSGPRSICNDRRHRFSSEQRFDRWIHPTRCPSIACPCRRAARTCSCRVACISDLRYNSVAVEVQASGDLQCLRRLNSSGAPQCLRSLRPVGSVSRMKHLLGVRCRPRLRASSSNPVYRVAVAFSEDKRYGASGPSNGALCPNGARGPSSRKWE